MRRGPAVSATAAALLCVALSACSRLAEEVNPPTCDPDESANVLLLIAQAVPSASQVPCIASMPVGWDLDEMRMRSSEVILAFNTDRNGSRVLIMELRESCDPGDAEEVFSDEPAAQRFELVTQLTPRYVGKRFYTFEGGCLTLTFDVGGEDRGAVAAEAATALTLFPRDLGNEELCRFSEGRISLLPDTCEGVEV